MILGRRARIPIFVAMLLCESGVGMRHLRWTVLVVVAIPTFVATSGCDDDDIPQPRLGELAESGAIVVPEGSIPGLRAAADDLAVAVESIAGFGAPTVVEGGLGDSEASIVVVAVVSPDSSDELGEQGYRIDAGDLGSGKRGIRVTGATGVGAMYGLYEVIADLGVRYHHPEQSYVPSSPDAMLPWDYDGDLSTPHFDLRGFHEHTQHPIVMSDFMLRPAEEFRPYVSRYIRWLARNRQNAMSWHMLKTVDLDLWLPYITDVVREAHDFGVRIGMVVSFVDQQQNNSQLIDLELVDEEGIPVDDEVQLRDNLDPLIATGFDFLTFQIGSSEFTKPDDDDLLRWLQVADDHLAAADPALEMFTWIHTTCELESDEGGYFYHLPLQAEPSVGAWVHTTMFYDLEHPAPVYGCESFAQQVEFLEAADGQRTQVYFPETAWWLGFDNNLPLALPLTGWTRHRDICTSLQPFDVSGHVTFTSGREWDYWQYDHYLTRVTWDGATSWEEYLDWIAPMYGEPGAELADVLRGWTELQRQHFLDDNPLIYFYLAGELRQDEIGQMAGILARRPKIAFATVVGYDDEAFETWRARDFEMLESMLVEYEELFETLPTPTVEPSGLEEELYFEAYSVLRVYVQRIEHTIELYSGAVEARRWRVERVGSEEPVESVREDALARAQEHLEAAQAITAEVIDIFAEMEAHYRYDVDLLAREKPESLTSYPFGYLEQTATGHFWTRRDDQLETLIGIVFETIPEEWLTEPEVLFYTDGDHTTMTVPEDPLIGTVITGFVPQMLFGLVGFAPGAADTEVVVAQDFNANFSPDPTTETLFIGELDGERWLGRVDEFVLQARNSAGELFGTLLIVDVELDLTLVFADDVVSELSLGTLSGGLPSAGLVDLVVAVGGIDEDGAANLIKSVFGVPETEALPVTLPVSFDFRYEPSPSD